MTRPPLASLIFASFAFAGAAHAQEAASVCNALKVELTAIAFEGEKARYALTVTLPPTACAVLPAEPELPVGDYGLRFIEKSGDQAMMCLRKVRVAPGLMIRIAADDGSRCIQ